MYLQLSRGDIYKMNVIFKGDGCFDDTINDYQLPCKIFYLQFTSGRHRGVGETDPWNQEVYTINSNVITQQ